MLMAAAAAAMGVFIATRSYMLEPRRPIRIVGCLWPLQWPRAFPWQKPPLHAGSILTNQDGGMLMAAAAAMGLFATLRGREVRLHVRERLRALRVGVRAISRPSARTGWNSHEKSRRRVLCGGRLEAPWKESPESVMAGWKPNERVIGKESPESVMAGWYHNERVTGKSLQKKSPESVMQGPAGNHDRVCWPDVCHSLYLPLSSSASDVHLDLG